MKITRLTKIYIAYAVDRDNSSESSKRGDSSRCVSSSGKQKLRKTIVFSKCSCLITRYTKSFSLLFPKSGRYFSFIQGARAKFLRATSVSISRLVTEIFHRWLTFHPPRIEGERYWSVWIFFFSFLFLHCCLSIWGYIYISQRFQFSFSSTFVRSVESIFSFQLFLQHPPTTLPDRENLRAILSLSLSGCNVLVDDFKGETFSMRIVFWM